MSWPPMLMHIKVKKPHTSFGLWLPICLLLPLALVIFIILSPFIIIATIFLWESWGRRAWLALWGAIRSFWSLRGLEVDIQNPRETIYISIV
jgi:hypothetical protein